MGDRSRDDLAHEVEADFAELEQLASAAPGLNELLRVYGGAESAVDQARAYLDLMSPLVQFTTSDRSR